MKSVEVRFRAPFSEKRILIESPRLESVTLRDVFAMIDDDLVEKLNLNRDSYVSFNGKKLSASDLNRKFIRLAGNAGKVYICHVVKLMAE